MKVLETKEGDRFYTVREAAKQLGVSRGRVLQLICRKQLPSIKVGMIRLIAEKHLLAYARNRRPRGRPKRQ
jgi:excisionase family DNA binding protein